MSKEEILHYFQDINFMYNDCGMKDTLSKCLDEYADEIRVGERKKAVDEFLFEIDQSNEIGISDEEFEVIKQMAEQIKEQSNEDK